MLSLFSATIQKETSL